MCTITSSNHPINTPILSFWQTFTVFSSLDSMERTIQKRRCEPPAKWLNKQKCMHIVNKSRCIRIICVFNGKRLKNEKKQISTRNDLAQKPFRIIFRGMAFTAISNMFYSCLLLVWSESCGVRVYGFEWKGRVPFVLLSVFHSYSFIINTFLNQKHVYGEFIASDFVLRFMWFITLPLSLSVFTPFT